MFTLLYAWVLIFAPVPLLIWWFFPPKERDELSVRVPFLDRVRSASKGEANFQPNEKSSLWIRFVLWLLILLAVARPQWLEPPIERTKPTRDLLLLVDLSGSMNHEDFKDSNGKVINRLDAAKVVLGDFLIEREGDRVGLVVFGNAPFLQVPFTNDLNLCQQLLDETEVGMAGPKTALGDGIGLGIKLFENSEAPTKTMITLTDGNDTGSAVPPAEAAKVAKDRDITIHTVAMGDPTTVGEEALDQESLKAVSQSTGGEYFLALNSKELTSIYEQLDKIETREVKIESHRPRVDLYYWPVLLALLISLMMHGLYLVKIKSQQATKSSQVRLKVNSRTFDLEVIE